MSTLVPSKREREAYSLPPGRGPIGWLTPFLVSTVGSKCIVALTGLGLTGFVIMHMIGNLKVFAGPESLNHYAQFLKDLGPLLWVARIGLLVMFVLHIWLALRLKLRSMAARPVRYHHEETVQATLASRTMAETGIVILIFTILHLAHFTFGWLGGSNEPQDPLHHDVYCMVITGFQNPVYSILYIVAQLFLLMHLSHGIASTFQSLGLNAPRVRPILRALSWTIALAVVAGNIAIVVAVWAGWVG